MSTGRVKLLSEETPHVLIANTKPVSVNVMNQNGLLEESRQAAISGIKDMIALTDAKIKIADLDNWKTDHYKSADDQYIPYRSVNWYLQIAKYYSRNENQLNADIMIDSLLMKPKHNNPHCDIILVHDDIYSKNTNFVIGLALAGVGAIISVHRFRGLDEQTRRQCIKTETMHELGHVFGLIPAQRTMCIDENPGMHCINRCIMRQGTDVPHDWIDITNDRLEYGPLCLLCQTDLKNIFSR